MSFTYSAIGDNTSENREHLEKIGYKDQMIKGNSILYACKGIAYTTEVHYPSFRLLQKEKVIDCRNNPALFRAVTAMREDSDYMQFFEVETPCFEFGKNDCYENRLMLCDEHSVESFSENIGINIVCWRKATLEELQEHFK